MMLKVYFHTEAENYVPRNIRPSVTSKSRFQFAFFNYKLNIVIQKLETRKQSVFLSKADHFISAKASSRGKKVRIIRCWVGKAVEVYLASFLD